MTESGLLKKIRNNAVHEIYTLEDSERCGHIICEHAGTHLKRGISGLWARSCLTFLV